MTIEFHGTYFCTVLLIAYSRLLRTTTKVFSGTLVTCEREAKGGLVEEKQAPREVRAGGVKISRGRNIVRFRLCHSVQKITRKTQCEPDFASCGFSLRTSTSAGERALRQVRSREPPALSRSVVDVSLS